MKKLYCERAEICGIFGSETYDSPQYILLINHMVCRYNKLCPCVRNTRDMVLFMMIYSDQKKQKLEKNTSMIASERSERAEILALLRRICFVIHIMTIPTKNNFEINASGPNELKVSYICIGNTQFSQYFNTMMSLCCLICTDEITKSTKLQKLPPPPPPVYATNDFNWKCGLHID